MSIQTILREARFFLSPLSTSIATASDLKRLLERLGYMREERDFDPVVGNLGTVVETITQVQEEVENYLDANASGSNPLDLIDKIVSAVRLIGSLSPAFVSAGLPSSTLNELLDLLFANYLVSRKPALFRFFLIIGVLEAKVENDREIEYVSYTFHWERLPTFLKSSEDLLTTIYGWSTSDFKYRLLLHRLEKFFKALGHFVLTDQPEGPFLERFLPSAISADVKPWVLQLPLLSNKVEEEEEAAEVFFGLIISAVEGSETTDIGLGIMPQIEGNLDKAFPVSDNIEAFLEGGGEVAGGIVAAFRPVSRFTIDTGILNNINTQGTFLFGVRNSEEEPIFLFGAPKETRFEVQNLETVLFTKLDGTNADFGIEFILDGGILTIESSDPDAFLKKTIFKKPIVATFSLTVGASSERGFFIGGEAAIEVTIPLHLKIDPLSIESLYLTLSASGDVNSPTTLESRVGVSVGLKLGPIGISLERIGLIVPVSFPADRKGKFGPLDIGFNFLPPVGAGLSINASGITGAGILDIDQANHRYFGFVGLNFGEIGMAAYGLISTKLPDGSNGFSMLIGITAIFDPPIQLSFGFTLSGVGGLIGINRTIAIEALQAGIKNQTIDSILFPDPVTVVANTSKMISDLRTVFPPENGRFVVGPVVRLGWGTPNIISGDLGIFLDLPAPVRIVLLGQLNIVLPDEERDLIVLRLDLLGVIDTEKKELTFQASLFNSRVLQYGLLGDAAFLLNWGENPSFALAVGGFHPRYKPPAPARIFEGLRRLTFCLCKDSSFQLTGRSYFALTPNSLQFGKSVEIYAKKSGFVIRGYLGFDAIFRFRPFSFEVDIQASVKLKYRRWSGLEISLAFSLSGPRPWHAKGKAKIKIFWFKIKIKFSITWGSSSQETLEATDPWPLFQEALNDPHNWGSVLPTQGTIVETLREREEEQAEGIAVHPSGSLEIRQNVVPLNIHLEKVGNAPIAGHDRCWIDTLSIDDKSLGSQPIQEFFPRGHFENLSRNQQLSVPSFEKFQSGITTKASMAIKTFGQVEERPLEYESILIQSDRTSKPSPIPPETNWFIWDEAQVFSSATAARRAIEVAGPHKRFSILDGERNAYDPSEESFGIVNADDLTRAILTSPAIASNSHLTKTEADRLLTDEITFDPDQSGKLLVVPECEVQEPDEVLV